MGVIKTGKRGERWAVGLGAFGVPLWVGTAIAMDVNNVHRELIFFPAIMALISFLSFNIGILSFEFRNKVREDEEVVELQERVRAEPEKPQLAWDLARIKLESYLDRNLRQVSSIYLLTVTVMLFGMGLIGVGVWRSITDPSTIQPASLAALAGVIVQIIGGTLLLIYRSTMGQAKDYVVVLERINAVGMSINILEGIQTATEMRENARVQLSTRLLEMYDSSGSHASRKKRKREHT
ncbi:hypothetical protein WBP07_12590 [Novosphingobium sp. BL-8A]